LSVNMFDFTCTAGTLMHIHKYNLARHTCVDRVKGIQAPDALYPLIHL